jgi:hypothetical protein
VQPEGGEGVRDVEPDRETLVQRIWGDEGPSKVVQGQRGHARAAPLSVPAAHAICEHLAHRPEGESGEVKTAQATIRLARTKSEVRLVHQCTRIHSVEPPLPAYESGGEGT